MSHTGSAGCSQERVLISECQGDTLIKRGKRDKMSEIENQKSCKWGINKIGILLNADTDGCSTG